MKQFQVINSKLPQCTKKKLMPDSPGLVDFAVGLVHFILHLPDGQVKVLIEFFEKINLIQRTCKNFLGLVKITSGSYILAAAYPKGKLGNWISLFPIPSKI